MRCFGWYLTSFSNGHEFKELKVITSKFFKVTMLCSDDAIRATNDDAASCKRFAVHQGYWTDPYIQHFIRTAERKPPEINRGYYARVQGMRYLLKQFLDVTKGQCQLLNLGAGFDTLYWNLKEEGLAPQNFIDMDFAAVTMRKCQYIKTRKPLLEKISTEDGEIKVSQCDLHAADYHVVNVDLRQLAEVEKQLNECNIDKNLPLVVIAECVLVYIEPNRSAALLKWLSETFNTLFFINYEQVNMNDRFGEVMVENLRARQCQLHGIQYCKNMESQTRRFTDQGWEGADGVDMSCVYNYLPQADVQRIERLEFLDERELLDQLFQHYCISWAYKDGAKLGLNKLGFAYHSD